MSFVLVLGAHFLTEIGMFLYATLTMENLFKQPNVRSLKEELESKNIPSDLEQA